MEKIFQASRRQCLNVSVTVLRGENVTQGWLNSVCSPNPCVKLDLPLSPKGRRQTKVINNNINPIWNETFQFYMDPQLCNVMKVTLEKAQYSFFYDEVQTKTIILNYLDHNIEHEMDLVFNEVIHVFIQVKITKCIEIPKGVRFSTKISDEEIEFRKKRRQSVFNALKRVLGEKGPKNVDEVPNVAIMGSGGGFRAMTALSGTFCALKDIEIADCSMYFAGLSGSSWYISTLYSHPKWPHNVNPKEVNNEVRGRVANHWARKLFSPSWLSNCISAIRAKNVRGEPTSLTDLFGYLIGDMLLSNRKNPILSSQAKTIEDGAVPMPLYACVNVKKDVSAEIFSEWVELSPFEIGMRKYGTYLTPEYFGNRYFCGVCVESFPELPLHFIQGCCGSAYTILMQRLLGDPINAKQSIEELESFGDDGQKALNDYIHSSATDHVDFEESYDGADDATSSKRPEQQNVKTYRNNATEENSYDASCDQIDGYQTHEKLSADVVVQNADDNNNVEGYEQNKNNNDENQFDEKDFQRFADYIVNQIDKTDSEDQVDGKLFETIASYFVDKVNFLKTRDGRAAKVHNPLKGLDLGYNLKDHSQDEISVKNLTASSKTDYMMLCDAGLVFNSPFPLILREDRHVDLILSFDYSARKKDDSKESFTELVKAEQWAKSHNYPFPHINHEEQFKEHGSREYYVFKNENDPNCPVVIHFPLVNNLFKDFKAPGIPRTTEEEFQAGKMPIFEAADNPYSTFNFHYKNEQFDRLIELTNFNVKVCKDVIWDELKRCIEKKRL